MLTWEEELKKIGHREYTTGSLAEYAGEDSIYNSRESDDNQYVVSGIILEALVGQHLLVDVKSAFSPQDILEVMPFSGHCKNVKVEYLKSLSGLNLTKSKPGSVVKIPYVDGAMKFNIIRKRVSAL